MRELAHVIDIRYAKANTRGKVHYMDLSGSQPLCRRQPRFVEIAGNKVDMLTEVSLPVDCLSCQKAMEMVGRQELGKLTIPQLEDVLALIAKLRNGQYRK